MSFILIAVGLFLLVKSADLFVDGCSNIAKALGIPPLIIGLTIVAFGTSAPETAVSVSASIKGVNDISLGNVVGSNICNLLLVLGFSSLAGTICTKKKVLTRDFMYVIFSGILLFIMGFRYFGSGGVKAVINRLDGVILLLLLVLYLYVLIKDAIKSVKKSIIDGSLALGASVTQTNFKVVLTSAKSGIFAGIILGVGRALGEATAISLVCSAPGSGPNFDLFNGTRTLTTTMLFSIHETTGVDYDIRFSVAVVLIIIILVSNILLNFIKKKIGRVS